MGNSDSRQAVVTLELFDTLEGKLVHEPLEQQDGVWVGTVEPMPGAAAISVTLRDGEGEALLAAEIPALGQRTIFSARFADGSWDLDLDGRTFLQLPANRQTDVPLVRSDGEDLDLAILVDGTAVADVDGLPFLLEPQSADAWGKITSGLTQFGDALERRPGSRVRSQVLAFADRAPAGLRASDLRFRYLIHPENQQRIFRGTSDLKAALAKLPPGRGGDPVDALAEGLVAVSQLNWRQHSRRVLLLCGNSPGYSFENPPEEDASAHSFDCGNRKACIEEALAELQYTGVLTMTLYLDLPNAAPALAPKVRGFLEWTRRQYIGIASLPELCYVPASWDPETAAADCWNAPRWIARGAAPGVRN